MEGTAEMGMDFSASTQRVLRTNVRRRLARQSELLVAFYVWLVVRSNPQFPRNVAFFVVLHAFPGTPPLLPLFLIAVLPIVLPAARVRCQPFFVFVVCVCAVQIVAADGWRNVEAFDPSTQQWETMPLLQVRGVAIVPSASAAQLQLRLIQL